MATITTPKMAPHAGRSWWWQALLGCGILASLLYVGMYILAAMGWEGYSYTDQTVSELFAIGAPTRPLVVTLMLTYSVLIIAFGWGVWASAGRKRALGVVGGLLVGLGVMGFLRGHLPRCSNVRSWQRAGER